MEVSCHIHAPVTLPQGNCPQYPLYRRLGGLQSWSECCGEEKNSQSLSGIEPQNPDRPVHKLVALQTETL
jgi:hypothetical protein